MVRVAFLAGAAALAPQVVHAQSSDQAPPPARERPESGDDFHGDIVVTASGLKRLDLLAGTSVVTGDDLQRNLAGQVGDILADLPGVSATSFSPGASRPVLRGFQGDRVRVLVDGIGSIDASNTSADHAVTIDPLTAERIEVLRGPAVLLYGSSAIGGAVNVIDKRIPRRVGTEPVHFDGIVAADTAYNLREGGASVDVPLSRTMAFHLDGSWRETADVSVGGAVVAEPLRADLLADAAEHEAEGESGEAAELREAATMRGVLPNSATRTASAGAGLAWIGSTASLGVSVGYYDTNYGIPARPGAGHHHEEEDAAADEGEAHGEEDVSIGLEQVSANLRGAFSFSGGPFEEVRTRWGYSDYKHIEFEGDEIGTTFLVDGVEGRVELVQRDRGGWRGSLGAQYLQRNLEAIGAEAFVPPNSTEQVSLFALQEVETGPVEFEFGGRFERSDIAAPTLGLSRRFDTLSGALGVAWEPGDGLRFGINGSHSQRAPSAEELFADGPHIATQQYELGDPALTKEKAWGLEGYVRGNLGPARVAVAVYQNWFDDFVYLQDSGLIEDDLPVYAYRQQGARFFGIEAEASMPLLRAGAGDLVADLTGEYIRATLDDGDPVPRIPPLSLSAGLEWQSDAFDVRGEVEWVDRQDRVAGFETPTDGYTTANLSLAWKPLRGSDNLTVMLQGDNLFDVTRRAHASFTKDFAPLSGRNVKLSVRVSL
ncbi:TonB-dependent receptor [Tsuneonella sp. HG222]